MKMFNGSSRWLDDCLKYISGPWKIETLLGSFWFEESCFDVDLILSVLAVFSAMRVWSQSQIERSHETTDKDTWKPH